MNYFIIVKTEWSFAADEFSMQLRERWPLVRLKEIQDPNDSESLEFVVPMENSKIYGSLNRKGNAVIFVGASMTPEEIVQAARSS